MALQAILLGMVVAEEAVAEVVALQAAEPNSPLAQPPEQKSLPRSLARPRLSNSGAEV